MHSYKKNNTPWIMEFKISEEMAYQSLKSFLYDKKFTRSFIKRINTTPRLQVNQQPESARYWLQPNDVIRVDCLEPAQQQMQRVAAPLTIFYEDDYLLIVTKPHNLLSLPRKGIIDSVAARVAHYFDCTHQPYGIHLLTRLDFGTSGLMLFAKTGYIHGLLSTTKMVKKYHATVEGKVAEKSYEIDLPIIREEGHGTKRMIAPIGMGKAAHTTVHVVQYYNQQTLVEAELHTGRTHQIRLHLAAIGHPIVGDYLYNPKYFTKDAEETALMLTCKYLSFIHPITEKKITCNLVQ